MIDKDSEPMPNVEVHRILIRRVNNNELDAGVLRNAQAGAKGMRKENTSEALMSN